MIWLRQSTAVVVSLGPAVLFSDGVSLVTNLVGTGANQTENTSTGIRLSKNGGAFAARHATATASTYDAFGNYLVTLDTTDTGTLGVLRMQYANASAFCPLFMDMMVVPAAVWDTYFASSGGAAFPTSGTLSILGGTAQTGDNFARLGAPAGASVSADVAAINAKTTNLPAAPASTTNITAGTISTVTTLTNLPSIPNNWLTAAGINAAALNGKGDWSTVTPTNLTAAQIATGIFQDATAGDFTVAGSIGKSIMNGVALGTGLTVNDLTTKTGYALTSAYDFSKGTVAMTESYAANGVAPTPVQALMAIHQDAMQFGISGVNYTVKKLDNSTTAFIKTLDSAVTPTAAVRT